MIAGASRVIARYEISDRTRTQSGNGVRRCVLPDAGLIVGEKTFARKYAWANRQANVLQIIKANSDDTVDKIFHLNWGLSFINEIYV